VIAEIGVNHDGEVSRALELTDAAAEAGADAVKVQYFETDRLMSKAAKLAAYQKAAGETDPIEMLRRLEMPLDAMASVVERTHARGIHAIVTVFSVELVVEAERLNWDAYKTASPDIVHRPLLERLAATGKPMIVSTGASTLDEVVCAVGERGWLQEARDRLAVLQCVSSYPAPDAAFGGIGAIARATGLPTGYSDHTGGVESAAAAVGHGACVLEKHVTWNNRAAGPDHGASLEPAEMAAYVSRAKSERFVGSSEGGEKSVLDCERDVREVSRQSIVATRDIAVGEVIGRGDVTFKRPGVGMLPYRLGEVVGAAAVRAIGGDVPIGAADVGLDVEMDAGVAP